MKTIKSMGTPEAISKKTMDKIELIEEAIRTPMDPIDKKWLATQIQRQAEHCWESGMTTTEFSAMILNQFQAYLRERKANG